MNTTFQRIKPSLQLQNFIKCYWALEKKHDINFPFQEIHPDGCLDLVCKLENNRVSSFFVGQHTRSIRIHQTGDVTYFGIQFLPHGAFPFFRIPIREFSGHIVTGPDIFSDTSFQELSERIHRAQLPGAIQAIESFLLNRLTQKKSECSQAAAAVKLLYQTRGSISIHQLTDKLNLTKRTLESKFEVAVGLAPKELAKVIRFNKIKNALVQNPKTNLTALGYEYQYFDQSHFIHDFRQITGITPAQFAARATC